MARQHHLLVAGASGVIGSAAVEHFAQLPGWKVTALSRREPVVAGGVAFDHVCVDLRDADACAAAISSLHPVTHLVYAAVAEAPGLAAGWRDAATISANGAMFANLLAPLAAAGALRHVNLLQGAKAYGAHHHAVTVPCREDQPRDDHANFYWLHEDLLRCISAAKSFDFTIWRPQVLLGWAPGAAMNPIAAIGAYAALCQARGEAFALPGESEALWELVDAALLAEAMAWAVDSSAASGETFNLTNGDVFVLRHHWTELAQRLGLSAEGTAPVGFHTLLAEAQTDWAAMAAQHGLVEPELSRLIGQSDHYLDLLLASHIASKSSPVLLSTIKLRQAGFAHCRDSFAALTSNLQRMVDLRLLPPLFN